VNRLRRGLRWLLVGVLVIALAVGGLFTWLVARGMPQREGTLRLPGLSAPVRVVRDENGIASIYASTTHDLFAAQGYVEASERMWQMEVWRHIGSGRLSELFGDSELQTDEFIRALGWRQAAERDWAATDADTQAVLQAYADGVNAWLDQHGDLPLPFVVTGLQGPGGGLAGYRPEPWTPVDTLVWQKVQAWSLGGNWEEELRRELMGRRGLTTQRIDELWPPYDPTRPTVVPSASAVAGTAAPARASSIVPVTAADAAADAQLLDVADGLRQTIALAAGGADLSGSNGFVVSPSLSATHGALLANDPHLDISMPSVWFLVGLHCQPVGPRCPYDVAGAGFPGVPGVVLGHNDRIAWGLTNVGPDVQDLFEETVDPADPTHYLYKGQSLPFDLRLETIKVAGAPDVTIQVRSTIHGPVISDQYPLLKPVSAGGSALGQPGYLYALAWTATREVDRTIEAVLGVNRAQNWGEFRDALKNFGAPSQTFLYADVDGNIGVQVPGLMPIRASGDGEYPVDGESGANDWTGYVPFDQLPNSYNPAQGFIVASNNEPVDPAAGPYLGRDWDPGYRAARITALLEAAGTSVTTNTLRSIQSDVTLTRAAPVIDNLSDADPQTADGQALKQTILDWRDDLTCTTESKGCAAYETFEYRLLRGLLDDELGGGDSQDNTAWRYIGTEVAHEFLARVVTQPDSPWWDDTSTIGVRETRDQIMSAALDAAGADLRHQLGDPANWTWGSIHTVTFAEQTLGTSGIGPLEAIFNRGSYPAPGTCTVVDKICGPTSNEWPQGDAPANLLHMFAATSAPSYRLVIDMSNLDGATILQATGQSGEPFDVFYGDYIQRWLDNDPLPLPWSTTAVDAPTAEALTLTP
jgi:penicillin amidase